MKPANPPIMPPPIIAIPAYWLPPELPIAAPVAAPANIPAIEKESRLLVLAQAEQKTDAVSKIGIVFRQNLIVVTLLTLIVKEYAYAHERSALAKFSVLLTVTLFDEPVRQNQTYQCAD
jgi:hypothetical protein